MWEPRSMGSRLFDFCLSVFIGALLIWAAVQLVRAVMWWLIGGIGITLAVVIAARVITVRRERW